MRGEDWNCAASLVETFGGFLDGLNESEPLTTCGLAPMRPNTENARCKKCGIFGLLASIALRGADRTCAESHEAAIWRPPGRWLYRA